MINNKDISPVSIYIDEDCREYYFLSNQQYTVPSNAELSKDGQELLGQAKNNFDNHLYKDVFVKYYIDHSNSGIWIPDPENKFYNNDPIHLNTFNNIQIHGLSAKQEKILTTSPIVIMNENWCLTKSGNIYKLGERINFEQYYKLMENKLG